MENKEFKKKECPDGFIYEDLPQTRSDTSWGTNLIVYSPNKTKFAFIYDSLEVSMGNEVGLLIFGYVRNKKHVLYEVAKDHKILLDTNPRFDSIHWMDNSKFLFRSQIYDSKTKQFFVPACGIDFDQGLFVVPNTNIHPLPLKEIELEKISFMQNINPQKMIEYFLIMQKQGNMTEYVHIGN